MLTKDPLGAAEQIVMLEELASSVRHDLRNRLGNIRNAAFWLRRRFEGVRESEDPRVATFFSLIDEEVFAADGLLERLHERFPPDHALADIDPLVAVDQAVKFVRLGDLGGLGGLGGDANGGESNGASHPNIEVVAEHDPLARTRSDALVMALCAGGEAPTNGSTVESAPGEIAVVVRALIELRAKEMEQMDCGGRITVRTHREANRLTISVPAPSERQGVWIDIARRTALKCGGSFAWSEHHGEPCAALTFPLGARRSLLIGLPRPAGE
ncbi:hypothetical protein [Pendulispora albinea]|uniref:histidine kinase n=1 Tax=Pendulispora albinea TaxID=2741071 RepID=A0ABZ2M363_9BACT